MNQSPKQAVKFVEFCYSIKQDLVPVTIKKTTHFTHNSTFEKILVSLCG